MYFLTAPGGMLTRHPWYSIDAPRSPTITVFDGSRCRHWSHDVGVVVDAAVKDTPDGSVVVVVVVVVDALEQARFIRQEHRSGEKSRIGCEEAATSIWRRR